MTGRLPRQVAASCIVLLLLVSWSLGAEGANGTKSFLWKAQGKGTVYLFGSVHLARADSYPLPRQVEESFDTSTILALEADPGAAMEPEMQQRMVLSALYAGNETSTGLDWFSAEGGAVTVVQQYAEVADTGSVSFAVLMSKAFSLPDPRTYGSHNPGATNVLRTGSKKAAILTLLGDALKGWIVVFPMQVFGPDYGFGPMSVALVALAEMTIPFANAHSQAIWQTQTPHELQGRVFAVRRVIAQFTWPLSTALAGLLGGLFNPGLVLAGMNILMAALLVFQLFNPVMLRVEDRDYLEEMAARAAQKSSLASKQDSTPRIGG